MFSSSIKVTAYDAYLNPKSGMVAAFSSSGTGNSFTPSSGVTNALGEWSSSFSSSKAEFKNISASLDGTWINHYAYVTVNPGVVSPSLSTITSSSAVIDAS